MKTGAWLWFVIFLGAVGGISLDQYKQHERNRLSGYPTREARIESYNDRVTLPIEAFGAHWRIKNFRKNVLFPDGFDEAMQRALEAAKSLVGRSPVISFAPTMYRASHPIDLSGQKDVTLNGAGIDFTRTVLP